MLFRLASDTEDNDEALGKLLTLVFSLCLLLIPSFSQNSVLGLPVVWYLPAAAASGWLGCSLEVS